MPISLLAWSEPDLLFRFTHKNSDMLINTWLSKRKTKLSELNWWKRVVRVAKSGTLRWLQWLGLSFIVCSLIFSTSTLAQQMQLNKSQVAKDSLRIALANYPGRTHLLPATPATTQWGWFDNSQPPVMEIASGDTVVVETMMHAQNQIVPGTTIEEIAKLKADNLDRGLHTVTGPIYVKEAEPGDILKVQILKIRPYSYATNFNLPGMFGAFPKLFPQGQVKYFYLDMDKKAAQFAPGAEIPLAPFPGIIGVARAEPGKYSTLPPGPYGGNLDIRDLVEGTTIYLPVFVKGALLWTGNSHAAQGNGEINSTGMDTAFKEEVLNVSVIKGKKQNLPRIETPTHWIALGINKDLDQALDIAQGEATQFLVEQYRMSPTEAAAVAQESNCHISQMVNFKRGIHCLIPKEIKTKQIVVNPTVDTTSYYVTNERTSDKTSDKASDEKGIDLDKAMKNASLAMLDLLQQKQKVSRLDAYALASMTMDCRIDGIQNPEKRVQCLVPKSLWPANR